MIGFVHIGKDSELEGLVTVVRPSPNLLHTEREEAHRSSVYIARTISKSQWGTTENNARRVAIVYG